MNKLNVITGLPRSGSTLVCNILNQNPKFWATGTSTLPQFVGTAINIWTNSLEIKGDLSRDKEGTEKRINHSLRSFCDSWHQRNDDRKIIFDKSRGWSHNLLALRALYPESRAIVIVRDLRNIFASIEKQHRKNPLFDGAGGSNEKTLFARADSMFSPKGLIGSPIVGVEDIIRRKLPAIFVKFEQLSSFPMQVMKDIYQYLEEPYFAHDFNNIENTATDVDAMYNFKYPHQGAGAVRPTDPNEWMNFMNEELANTIMGRFPFYNNFFGYK